MERHVQRRVHRHIRPAMDVVDSKLTGTINLSTAPGAVTIDGTVTGGPNPLRHRGISGDRLYRVGVGQFDERPLQHRRRSGRFWHVERHPRLGLNPGASRPHDPICATLIDSTGAIPRTHDRDEDIWICRDPVGIVGLRVTDSLQTRRCRRRRWTPGDVSDEVADEVDGELGRVRAAGADCDRSVETDRRHHLVGESLTGAEPRE